ncbi:VOC family protein [Rossellomorea vietnamensis]|uniref:VOC family protein n=2 Tax=Rossellomorea TaxID=2837508 RepID=A0A5D4KC47_9BACI|nr:MULTISPECIES: VOC family protein [Rossellomorea]TYR74330.1 VOC family protein [Rossellomorea vietnamensis]TYS77043.1 VOC family protein [Rossellomorea aquimaris]
MSNKNDIGQIQWRDLTVENADHIKDFYSEVIGWKSSPHPMGEYHDYNMHTPSGETVTGICHAKGINSSLPPQWLMYVKVESVKESAERCVENGGKIIDGPKMLGQMFLCVIQDPAGAVLAIHE